MECIKFTHFCIDDFAAFMDFLGVWHKFKVQDIDAIDFHKINFIKGKTPFQICFNFCRDKAHKILSNVNTNLFQNQFWKNQQFRAS